MNQLVSTEWLEKNLQKVKILDATWFLPNSNKDAYEEYKIIHIKNSIFFDLDKSSNQNSKLPHMLPSKLDWEQIVSNLGINNSDHIVIYDNSDVFSSCRVWYTFIYFGHDNKLVSVLDGNFKKWLNESRPVSKEKIEIKKTSYKAKENLSMIVNKDQVKKNILNRKFQLIDARSKERFLGIKPEPRKGLKSGHIEGSKNLPFHLLLNNDRTLKKKEELLSIFKNNEVALNKDMVFTCGSGVTACILGLANSIINGKNPTIYDGSWAEYGLE
ncbi:thiosulfate sulfurtransferase [SAR11 cluster bacterium PRT-SC02]|nr:thiosulfate sulfurtransferase [SAR11 cluster bacterium PRT-SC02]